MTLYQAYAMYRSDSGMVYSRPTNGRWVTVEVQNESDVAKAVIDQVYRETPGVSHVTVARISNLEREW